MYPIINVTLYSYWKRVSSSIPVCFFSRFKHHSTFYVKNTVKRLTQHRLCRRISCCILPSYKPIWFQQDEGSMGLKTVHFILQPIYIIQFRSIVFKEQCFEALVFGTSCYYVLSKDRVSNYISSSALNTVCKICNTATQILTTGKKKAHWFATITL